MKNRFSWIPLLASLLGATVLSLPAHGESILSISIGNLDLLPGGSGYVDVMIRSDTGTDSLDMFGVEFRITSGSTMLEFVDPAPDPQLTDTSYLFDGDSAAGTVPPAGSISSVVNTNDTYIGGDGTLSGSGVTVPTTDTLLARLQVTAATSAPPVVGDTFTISLISGGNTFFYDPSFGDITFDSTPGTVTITPEPGEAVMLLGLALMLGIAAIFRKRTRAAAGA